MILNAGQINDTIAKLKNVLAEQQRILAETEKIVLTDLAGAWECQAQKAYADAFVSIKNSLLTQINGLIELFGTAFVQSQNGLYQVDVDISTMNVTAITGK
ncbi:MAG: hypothetical protein WAZ69_09620 [Trichococcus flocculiformis]